jgi:hypothetical protein
MVLADINEFRKQKQLKVQETNEEIPEELDPEDEEILKQIGILMPEFEGSTYD